MLKAKVQLNLKLKYEEKEYKLFHRKPRLTTGLLDSKVIRIYMRFYCEFVKISK